MNAIPLTQGKVALVDESLLERLAALNWYAHRGNRTWYAECRIQGRIVRMQNLVFEMLGIEIPNGHTVDHRDGDGLNNQGENLRLATRTQQQRNRRKRSDNSSGYTGVSWLKHLGKWQAQVQIDGKRRRLGVFDDPISAAFVRDEFIREHFGEFGRLNDVQDRRQCPR